MAQVITARNRADYEAKVKAALKSKYKEGETVNFEEFKYQFGVKVQNIRKVVDDLQKEGYNILLPLREPTQGREGRGPGATV